MTDEALLAASREGVHDAFADLVDRYKDLVCALAFSATGNRAQSEDLAQDTFLVAWRSLHELRDPGRFRGWLCGIARNLARNARRDGARELATDAVPELPDDAGMLEALSDAEEAAIVWRALAEMPESYREPLVLYYREGRSTSDVAQSLGVSVETVEQRLSRGRKQLKRSVEAMVERVLERSRPGTGFVATVMAALGTAAVAPSTASAATKATALAKGSSASLGAMFVAVAWKALVVGAVATAITYGCASWNEAQESASDVVVVAASPNGVRAMDEPARRGTRAAEIDEVIARREQSRDVVVPSEGDALPNYEITVLSPQSVAVNLAGGRSPLTSPNDDKPIAPAVRTISGVVRDRDGSPSNGVVVIAGRSINSFFAGQISGNSGTTTADGGRFSIAVNHDEKLAVLALASSGWSQIATVAAGTDDRSVELRLGEPGRVTGTLRRDGAVVQPQATLVSDATAARFIARVVGNDDGSFAFDVVPPGRYQLSVGESGTQGSEASVSRTIDVRPGRTVGWDAELASGTMIAVDVRLPDDSDHETITYTLVPGAAPGSLAQLNARLAEIPRTDHRRILFGGIDLDNVMEFDDVGTGEHAVCVELGGARGTIAFGCNAVDVRETRMQEVVVAPLPITPE